jgi:hypothetical protein
MKNKTLLSIFFAAGCLLSTGAVVSCTSQNNSSVQNSTEKVTAKSVTFKIQGEDGQWKNYCDPVEIKDGQVTLPTNPSKKYYTFRGWFLDTGWVNEFQNENLTEGVVVYAYFVADEVNIYINGESQGTRDLIDVINGTYNPGEGLTFDGWYTDPDCKVKYKEGDPAKTLYAQSVATITFNNGYEDVYVAKIKPNTTMTSPALETVEDNGVTSTIEATQIVKSYMSSEDIYYLDSEGNEIDFTKPFSKNQTIKVAWKSPFLKYKMCDNESGNQILLCLGSYGGFKGSDPDKAKYNEVPVISFPHKVTLVDKDGNKTTNEVNGAYVFDNKIFSSSALKKVIVQEGVKFIRGFSSTSGTSGVTSFELPSTLKIIQDCFNNLSLTSDSVQIPSGVDAIYDSFWKNATVNYNNEATTYYTGTAYDFDISVPDSVKSLSIVPLNLKFSNNSSFANNGKMITQTTEKGKVLISYDEIDDKGIINVPEGIEGIQVGTFVNRSDIKKLVLPTTFKFVNYNLNLTDYQDCYGWYQGDYTCNECYLYSSTLSDNDFAYCGRMVVSNLDTMTYLVFNSDVSEDVYKAFGGNATSYAYMMGNFTSADDEVYKDIKAVSQKETTTPTVKATLHNEFTDDEYTVTIERENQNAITYQEILTAMDGKYTTSYASQFTAKTIKVNSTLNMLEDYDISQSVKKNLYLDIYVDYTAESAGVTYETENNEVKITGFDQNTAISLPDGSYGIILPNTISGKNVTSIEEGAFKDNGLISIVKLGKNLKTISKDAFKDAVMVSKIDFNGAKLETIGESAFEGVSTTSLSFSIASLKTLGTSAFKTTSLTKFVPVNGEETRDVTNVQNGEFYFVKYQSLNDSWTALIDSYLVLNQKVSSTTDSETNKTTYDVKMYAYCNGASNSKINIGEINTTDNYVVRYEVMAGSMTGLSLDSTSYIALYSVSVIHKDAITSSTVNSKGIQYSADGLGITTTVSTIQNLVEAVPTLFEEGWIDNYESIKTVKTATLR